MTEFNEYKFIIDAAKNRFPGCEVWGQAFHDGSFYALMLKKKSQTVSYQLKSKVWLNGRELPNDILGHGDKMWESIHNGFNDMEKNLNRLLDQRSKWQKIKDLFVRAQ